MLNFKNNKIGKDVIINEKQARNRRNFGKK